MPALDLVTIDDITLQQLEDMAVEFAQRTSYVNAAGALHELFEEIDAGAIAVRRWQDERHRPITDTNKDIRELGNLQASVIARLAFTRGYDRGIKLRTQKMQAGYVPEQWTRSNLSDARTALAKMFERRGLELSQDDAGRALAAFDAETQNE